MEVEEAEVLKQQAYLLLYGAAAALPALRKGAGAQQGANGSPEAGAPLPSRCRGRGGKVCTFFACSDGLCTCCYQEEHGKPPPAPATSAPEAAPAATRRSLASSKSGAGSSGRPASGKAPGMLKAKKVGPN